jgi:hypothetical protein
VRNHEIHGIHEKPPAREQGLDRDADEEADKVRMRVRTKGARFAFEEMRKAVSPGDGLGHSACRRRV